MVQVRIYGSMGQARRDMRRRVNLARTVMASQARADMDQFVPKLSGDMRSQSQVSQDGKSIIYNVPYAAAQFYNPGGKFKNYTTPGTGPRWDLKAKSIYMESWARVAKAAGNL